EPGAVEAGAALTGARAVPVQAHDPGQEVLELRRVLGGDHDHVAEAAVAGDEAAVRTAGNEGTRRPLLRVEEFVLVTHRVAKTDQLLDPTLLAQRRIADAHLDVVLAKARHGGLKFELALGFPTDVDEPVGLAGMKGQAMAPVVELE